MILVNRHSQDAVRELPVIRMRILLLMLILMAMIISTITTMKKIWAETTFGMVMGTCTGSDNGNDETKL